jgi:hypothetical protein
MFVQANHSQLLALFGYDRPHSLSLLGRQIQLGGKGAQFAQSFQGAMRSNALLAR